MKSNTTLSAHTAASPWTRHLVGAAPAEAGNHCAGGAHVGPGQGQPAPTLSMAEAQRVQRYRDRLVAALQSQDRSALRSAKHEVMEAAFRSGAEGSHGSAALRRALRDLCWRMAGLMLPRQRSRQGSAAPIDW